MKIRGDAPLEELIAEARTLMTCPRPPDISLCVDNVRRQTINRETNLLTAPEGSLRVLGSDGPMFIFVGQWLIGSNTSNGVLNGVMYEVVRIADKVTLREGDQDLLITPENLGKSLRLVHAMTIFGSQSRTLRGVVRICLGSAPGIVHSCFSKNLLLVACSRATSLENLIIE